MSVEEASVPSQLFSWRGLHPPKQLSRYPFLAFQLVPFESWLVCARGGADHEPDMAGSSAKAFPQGPAPPSPDLSSFLASSNRNCPASERRRLPSSTVSSCRPSYESMRGRAAGVGAGPATGDARGVANIVSRFGSVSFRSCQRRGTPASQGSVVPHFW